MLLAVVAGRLSGTSASIGGVTFYELYNFVGQLFLNALTLVVIPLIASAVISGAARMGHQAGRLGAKTFACFVGINFLALLIGLAVSLLIHDFVTFPESVDVELTLPQAVESSTFAKIESVFFKLIPTNLFAAAASGQILGVIAFCFLFGFFLNRNGERQRNTLTDFWQGTFDTLMGVTEFIMRALPIGVFALVAKVIASTGIQTLLSAIWLLIIMVAAITLYIFVVLPLLLYFTGRIQPVPFYRALAPALLTAFSTSSSAATLPVLMECVEKDVGVPNRIAGFTLPLGSAFNMAGTTMFCIVAVLFVAQAYHAPLEGPTLLLAALMSFLVSFGMAGIPSASLVAVVVVLTTMGLPAEGIGLLMPVERIVDMLRTLTNSLSNGCTATLVARLEKEPLSNVT
ncbi:MAG: dicarboxylate/amino acid:cation symporter [Chlamydiia bacterium]|nr:dicarboxylate/amino acid:cation symporter [Chlamydiia bacterium]